MVGIEDVTCPHCGEPPTETSVEEALANDQLRALGYVHDDKNVECPNGHTWTHGIPKGDPETTEMWTCDACGGQYIPRDVFHSRDHRLHFVVKCEDCYYKPDDPLHFDIPEEMGEEWGILLGHPKVCGNTEDATDTDRVKLTA